MANNLDYNYIMELESEEIPELKSRIIDLNTEKDELALQLSKIGLFTVPFRWGKYDIGEISILSNKFTETWESYKKNLYEENSIRPLNKRFKLISAGLDTVIYRVTMALVITTELILLFFTKAFRGFFINPLATMFFIYAIYEFLVGLISVNYFLFRPNRTNKSACKRELKEIKAKLKVLQSTLTSKEALVEQYKLATIDPNKEFANIKRNTTNGLRSILQETIDKVIPQINNEKLRESYSSTLEKCEQLLRLGEENGTIVTEISSIYNIYLNDINSLLLKSNTTDIGGLYTMLSNFDDYVNRKLKKFSDIGKMSLDSEVNALNSKFMED